MSKSLPPPGSPDRDDPGSYDPAELTGAECDAFLEGELDAARPSDPAQYDPEVRTRLAARAAFLAALSGAGAQYRAGLSQATPSDLSLRVRAALARESGPAARSPGPRSQSARWVAYAAVLVAALGVSFWPRPASDAEAMPPEVLKAAEAARMQGDGPGTGAGTCVGTGEVDPLQFPLIKDGSLRILRCAKDGSKLVAQLHRPEDLPTVGYVAVAEPGTPAGPTIGMTDVGEHVVYDLAYGRQRHYLAVSKAFLERERKLTPGRESCRACHNRSREGKANPHNIVKRSWRLGG